MINININNFFKNIIVICYWRIKNKNFLIENNENNEKNKKIVLTLKKEVLTKKEIEFIENNNCFLIEIENQLSLASEEDLIVYLKSEFYEINRNITEFNIIYKINNIKKEEIQLENISLFLE